MKLFGSLGARIYGVAVLAIAAALLLGAVLLNSSHRSRAAFDWVHHSQEVLIGLYSLRDSLGEAESGVRGYLLSGDETYIERFDTNLAEARTHSARLTLLVQDNAPQKTRAMQLASLASEKMAVMRNAVARARARDRSVLPNADTRTRGRVLMAAIAQLTTVMRDEERRLLAMRTDAADGQIRRIRTLLLYGCPILALLVALIAWQIRTSISRPLADLLDVVTRFGAGDRQARARDGLGSQEFKQLATAYNGMAERLVHAMDQQEQTEAQLAHVNAELVERSVALEARQRSVQLLSEMSHRLQAIQTEGELAEVLDCFMPQVLPDVAGALYVHNHSRNMLMRVSAWGAPRAAPEMFPPSECWGLRRGKPHRVESPRADLVCAHAAGAVAAERHCLPVLAGGEVLGLLYVEGPADGEVAFRLSMLMENVGLALVNENLRSRLREQSIRDPLTKLFNRRYMEEAVALETARAQQNATDLSIVMCDIDHFKRFNDGHGHQAGDVLLSAVAALIQAHFRHGEIVCRYGGEEFTVIAPGASASLIYERAEALRMSARHMLVDHHGQQLGPVTMSFGVGTWTAGENRLPSTLLGEADRALFRAKRLGRDRIEVASLVSATG